ncbi:hypothetical protein FKM82_019642 [Ascaphus truei]
MHVTPANLLPAPSGRLRNDTLLSNPVLLLTLGPVIDAGEEQGRTSQQLRERGEAISTSSCLGLQMKSQGLPVAHQCSKSGVVKSSPQWPPTGPILRISLLPHRLVASAADKLRGLVQSGAEQYVAWNRTSVELVEASMGHCRYMIVKTFVEALKTLGSEPEIQKVLKRVCDLHALHGIFTSSGDFLHDGYLSGKQMGMVTTAYLDLLALIRKDAVLLVDAFDYTDEMLLSALGTYDGNVYHHLFEWAQKDPANTQVDSVFENYLKPYLHGSQSKL